MFQHRFILIQIQSFTFDLAFRQFNLLIDFS